MSDGIRQVNDRIGLAHGSGGAAMHGLIRAFLQPLISPGAPPELDDAAEFSLPSGRIAFTTDTFVVKPIFFPGGDIGSLSVSGTVNDLLMKGAVPLYLSLGLVIEEGFPTADLRRILESIRRICDRACVSIVTGDTKVVGKGDIDGIFINTSGIGTITEDVCVGGEYAEPGDVVIVSGDIGRHGVAVMAERNGLRLSGNIESDAALLNEPVFSMLGKFGGRVSVMRDPTRGGLAATLNEIAEASGIRVVLDEEAVPVSDEVGAVCDLLGFDPFHLPCEGRFIAFVENAAARDIVSLLRPLDGCDRASIIGVVEPSDHPEVILRTRSGGRRIIDMPAGELLPRIC